MSNVRLIARLDIKGPNLIKGIHLEGLRVIGPPNARAIRYYQQGIDELIYMDCVASLYGRNHLSEIIKGAAKDIFVPLTVGGGIRTVEDATEILRSGADKVAINSAAVATPKLISEAAKRFGSQCLVVSIDYRQHPDGKREVFTCGGSRPTGLDPVAFARQVEDLGAGEILFTSVERDGTMLGYDLEGLAMVCAAVGIPVIASGGAGSYEDMYRAVAEGGASAVAAASIFHFTQMTPEGAKRNFASHGLPVRLG